MFYDEPTTLIVVYKDETLVNQVKKLVESKDDESAENIVGTKDGTVSIVSWNEKFWLEQKAAGVITNKVLFLGEIKGTDNLIPIIDLQFDEFGVKYGWAGNQAILYVDPKAISKKSEYDKFLKKLNEFPVPEKIKAKVRITPTALKVGLGIATVFGFVSAAGVGAVLFAKDVFSDKKAVKQQMFFYGIMNLYSNHLEEFVNA